MKPVTVKLALLLSVSALIAVSVYALSSCGTSSSGDGGSDGGGVCVSGSVQVCSCPSGDYGYQVCDSSEGWGVCQGCGFGNDVGSVDHGPFDAGEFDGHFGGDAFEDASTDTGAHDAGMDGGDGGAPVESCNDYGGNLGWMCDVPAGDFWMGCNAAVDTECFDDEYPYHKVAVSAFKIDKYEVTTSQYGACVTAAKCAAPNTGGSCNWESAGHGGYPINCLDWEQAKAYCTWAGKRLPTEAEWEKAARGPDGRKYPWGNTGLDCDHAVWNGSLCKNAGTQPDGSKPLGVSPYGGEDMVGNVWEWVSDWYSSSYYGSSSQSDPQGPLSGTTRVLRGGSWNYEYTYFMRTSVRNHDDPLDPYELAGFRCAHSGEMPDGGFPDAGQDGGAADGGGSIDGATSDAGVDGGTTPDAEVDAGTLPDAEIDGGVVPDAEVDGGTADAGNDSGTLPDI